MRAALLLSLPLILALGCRKEPEPIDNDGDGWEEAFDCDDADPDVHPDADEVCNGIDDNCDEVIDEDAVDRPTWYLDADADGYGDELESLLDCEQPESYVADNTDCDDDDPLFHPGADEWDCTDPNDYNCDGSVGYADEDEDGFAACEECDDSDRHVNPDAVEVCDEIDNDCDGDIDGPTAIDSSPWYEDLDVDGFGNPLVEAVECEAPEGWVADDEDCDDTDAAVHPGAIEVCDGIDNDCDGTTDGASAADSSLYYADTDADGYGDETVSTRDCDAPSGYVSDSTDCDDADGEVHPGAAETCNEGDDDCDGDVDESAVDADTWYLDADEDGYGAAWLTQEACEQPSGFVADSTDCDDLDDTSYPGATEYCDDADNDCDGTIDDSPVDEDTWYADDDADGYGDVGDSTDACDAPTGYVADATDCDDSSAAARPGGTEVCDTLDNDCDGTVDESTAVDALTWYDDDDGDGYGDATDTTGACTQPSGYVAVSTDCDDTDYDVNPGADEYCNSYDDDCDGTIDEDDAVDADTWYADYDEDGHGSSRFPYTACEAPSGYVLDDTDCDDLDDTSYPGADEVCDGADNDCDGDADSGTYGGDSEACAAVSCDDVMTTGGYTTDDVYWIDPDGTGAYEVYCDLTTDGGGWTLLGIFTNNDTTVSWAPTGSSWVSATTFGDPTDPTVNADAKSEAYNNLPIDEVLVLHADTTPYTVGVQSDTSCVGWDTMLDFMSVDSETDSNCAAACGTVDLGYGWSGQSYQDGTLRFRCADGTGTTDGGGYVISGDDNSMITTLTNTHYVYNFGLGSGYGTWYADWDNLYNDSADDSDTVQALLYGR